MKKTKQMNEWLIGTRRLSLIAKKLETDKPLNDVEETILKVSCENIRLLSSNLLEALDYQRERKH